MSIRHPPTQRPPSGQPIINLPRVTAILMGTAIAIQIVLAAVPPRWEALAFFHFGFIPARYTLASTLDWQAVLGPITHQFLHGGLAHILLNMVMLAAFGAGVERVIGGTRLIVLFLLCGIAGAFFHLAVFPESFSPVIGASGSISGLFGAALRVMARQSRQRGQRMRLLPIAGIWIGIAVITGFTGVPGTGGAQIAWAAHIGGFVAGFVLFSLFSRGGPRLTTV